MCGSIAGKLNGAAHILHCGPQTFIIWNPGWNSDTRKRLALRCVLPSGATKCGDPGSHFPEHRGELGEVEDFPRQRSLVEDGEIVWNVLLNERLYRRR